MSKCHLTCWDDLESPKFPNHTNSTNDNFPFSQPIKCLKTLLSIIIWTSAFKHKLFWKEKKVDLSNWGGLSPIILSQLLTWKWYRVSKYQENTLGVTIWSAASEIESIPLASMKRAGTAASASSRRTRWALMISSYSSSTQANVSWQSDADFTLRFVSIHAGRSGRVWSNVKVEFILIIYLALALRSDAALCGSFCVVWWNSKRNGSQSHFRWWDARAMCHVIAIGKVYANNFICLC